MSPSESELRASLHAGEGERLDADALLAHARASRRERRRNLAAVGGAVVAVLAVGGAVTAIQLDHGNGAPHAATTRSGTLNATAPTTQVPVPGRCPGSAPVVPNVTGPASGPLFPDDVTSIRVCVYDVDRLSGTTVLDQPVARMYAQRFNGLPPTRPGTICPQFMTTTTIALLPSTDHGPADPVVGRIGGCGTTTNGTASRNATGLLGELQRGTVTSSTPVPTGSARMTHGPGPSR